MTTTAVTYDLVDEDVVTDEVCAALHGAPRTSLGDRNAQMWTGPAVYAMRLAGPHRLYRPPRDGRLVYVGSATSLAERLGRHRSSIDQAKDLTLEQVRVAALPTGSLAAAVYLEHLIARRLRPVWNEPWLAGFGSRQQGRVRTSGQRRTAWDCLHPGRRWATAPPAFDRHGLAERVRAHLEQT